METETSYVPDIEVRFSAWIILMGKLWLSPIVWCHILPGEVWFEIYSFSQWRDV